MTDVYPDEVNAGNTLDIFRQVNKKVSKKKEDILYHLSSYSRFIGREITRNPTILDYLVTSKYTKNQKPYEQLLCDANEISNKSQSINQFQSEIKKYKYKEFARIILKDIRDRSVFVQTMQELSDLASAIVSSVIFFHSKDDTSIWDNFVVIAMGKLGGRELNLSSDIDLIYLFDGSDNLEAIFKFAENITKTLSNRTEDGFLYRVDLGLRPGGGKSPIAVSLEGSLEHYNYWGDTWERGALIKARPIAGNIELGNRFIKEVENFIYKRHLDFASIEDIKEMKFKLDSLHKVGDVKLGKGGIREIEFFVNAFQLIHGGNLKELRSNSLLKTLGILTELKFISDDIRQTLESSYIFLRKTEHFIQLVEEKQTHALPTKTEDLQLLAKRVGLKNEKQFTKEYSRVTNNVSEIYNKLFLESSQKIEQSGKEFWELADFLTEGHISEEQATNKLNELGFQDPKTALIIIEILLNPKKGGLTQRGRSLSKKIIPVLLKYVISSVNPDVSLRNVDRFLSSIGSRSSIYSVLLENPEICALLSKLFSTSAYLSAFLIKHPEYLDILTLRSVWKDYKSCDEMTAELSETVKKEPDFEGKLDSLRRFKHVETLKLSMMYLNGELEPGYLGNYISMIADAVVNVGLKVALKEMKPAKNRKKEIVVIGMGKLGGREMGYNSDLDVIFVYNGDDHEYYSKLGQKLISVLSIPTGEGFAFKIDMGLRPSGNAGALVSSLESFKNHHKKGAMLWERQALLKARVIAGDKNLAEKVMSKIEGFVYKQPLQDESIKEISRLRKRMELELAKETKTKFNIKTGHGGLVDIDFVVQLLQLKHGAKHKKIRNTNTIQALESLFNEEIISESEFKALDSGYKFLRRIENAVRLIQDKATSDIQIDDFNKAGEIIFDRSGESVLKEYKSVTKKIRKIYNSYFS
ncbi:MAG: bifunctional [glutamate--ammonia ligase]-adenylyl-L-tyrosine phosphorylase/[glutamate--ammonia-ligase] adenylyltransferase [Candidatus Dadabacteria bacterium]|nr:bifunctional [glutamate--ammonia ligase]-adenylyl-L-tyrosine phosphorylase/[glutamate--ammonia-ligase] adenylyltransferase [Candidatus Dadabacteria bacterium]NIV41361.1 bifunctional [glutamate--ammonia ligase]-adenylyl-L-tyrosine phosphorylase/[glutamate--ammonia-ligase] adenylyltransferase [Candidatus Dadabacteria bacterium]NIX16274.1 bifunctional [glutamate--ammonia ligase]-adenylyl-L-tyrosine phosphorylase/[glutamate--ammonia-ligase] adenylyltransferase [Candidatus Dadabacteria bacterium]